VSHLLDVGVLIAYGWKSHPQQHQERRPMHLTPTELDRLTLFTAAELARRRRAKGWKLTHPEALAIICDEMHEAARGGASYDEVARAGRTALTADDVLDSVPALIGTVKLECLFGDGTRVLHVEQPIGPGRAAAPPESAR
jgi:urease subunit gamma/beta